MAFCASLLSIGLPAPILYNTWDKMHISLSRYQYIVFLVKYEQIYFPFTIGKNFYLNVKAGDVTCLCLFIC